MQTLSKVAPEFAGQVDFYLVSYNEDAATLDAYASGQSYTDVIAAQPVGRMLRDLEIVSQSSMMALDGDGIITYRKGFGGGSESTLRAQFEQLAAR